MVCSWLSKGDALIEGMYTGEQNAENEAANGDTAESGIENDNGVRAINVYDRKIDAYLEAAEDILSPSQFDKYDAYMEKERSEFLSRTNRIFNRSSAGENGN